jgi:hypothetical protein
VVRQKAHDVFHEKADPGQECFYSLGAFCIFPFSQAASVATLPSALLVNDFRSVPVVGVLDSVGAAIW